MHFRRHERELACLISAAAVMAFLPPAWAQTDMLGGATGDVYVLTNQASGNSIMVFHRDAWGGLAFINSVPTGGNGAGSGADPLGSQGSLVLSDDGRLLFAVNAGSDSVTAFATLGNRLVPLNTAASGGVMPVSLAVRHDLVYVLNAGGTSPNISGFRIDPRTNQLVPLPGSTQPLPGGSASAGAQVSFSPDGGVLVVTEKGTNSIDTFVVERGVAQPGVSFPSSGTTPFGFAFGHDDAAIVSEAGSGALSSYDVEEDGTVTVITPSLGDTQSAACWVAIPRNGRFAYTTNSASGTISSYTVSEDGSLALLNAVAASTGDGSTPVDMALSGNSRFLYVRNAADGTILGFRIGSDGSLKLVASGVGVPSGAQGIAAR